MPFNGSGTYSAPSSPGAFNPATTSQQATPAAWNTLLDDLEAALSLTVTRDGQSVPTANLPMGGFRHTGVGNGVAATDYAALGQVQNGEVAFTDTIGTNTMSATLVPAITAYAVGQTFTCKKSGNANTTAVTLNLNSIGAGAIVWPNGTALAAGDLPANCMFEISVQDISTPTAPVYHLLSTGVPPLSASVLTTEGDILYRNATVPTRLALGTLDMALTAGATAPVWGNRIGAVRMQTFTATGTYTPHAKMIYCVIQTAGAGGGGGGTATAAGLLGTGGGGGGAGSVATLIATAADIGASKAVTIGAAGTAGSSGNNAGGAGGDTSVGTLCIGKGGAGGAGSDGASPALGGLGGVAGTGTTTPTGQAGTSTPTATVGGVGGAGGSGPFGGGARGVVTATTATGDAATGKGSGGGGGASFNAGGAAAGAAGTAGYVVVTEYCTS